MNFAIISPYISSKKDVKFYQSQQINLAQELSKCGISVDIITLQRCPNDMEEETIATGVRIYRLPLLSQKLEKYLRQPALKGLSKFLSGRSYDYIQTSEDNNLTTLMTAIHSRKFGCRMIIFQGFYSYSSKRIMGFLMKSYDACVGWFLRRQTWCVVCKTEAARRYMVHKGYRKTLVIPVGVNTELFSPDRISHKSSFEILSVGTLIPRKNFPLLLDTFRCIASLNKLAHLTIIGNGPEKNKILKYIKNYDLYGKVTLIDRVHNNLMRKQYSKADLFLLFSKIEIFGMVILEAMACRCPVASTPIPGALDVIENGKTGLIFETNDPESIARKINCLLNDNNLLASEAV